MLFELRRELLSLSKWSTHAKITVVMSALLFLVGALFLTITEWANPRTLGGLSPGGQILAGVFGSVSLRTAGFNTVDIGGVHHSTWLGMDVLMFIGGGSAGTTGMSTGVTAQLPGAGLIILTVLMFLGRLGPVTLVSALALRDSQRRYEFPEGRPLIG